MTSPRQSSFEDLGTSLFDTTFTVLDIETTGGSASADTITEVGAVKSRGGKIIGTFQTLVRPAEPIMASVELLTGISDAMVIDAPPIEEVLPNLWGFLDGSVLVAHNAHFDAGFLEKAFTRYGYSVPFDKAVCTLRIARRLLRGETMNMKLETLAASFGVATRPCHRAFADAKATFEIFHRLLELAGPLGVVTSDDLFAFQRERSKPYLSKIALAARIPRKPGVYKFIDRTGKLLYVGKAKDLRSRVRSYFYGDERQKVSNLISQTAKVEFEKIDSPLGAEVRELRLIQSHQPRFNRRGKDNGKRPAWIRTTEAKVPRFAITSKPQGPEALGPFTSHAGAKAFLEAIQEAAPVPRCTDPAKNPNGCAFGAMGRCLAPCQLKNVAAHRSMIEAVSYDMATSGRLCFESLSDRMQMYSACQRYEEAGVVRDRIDTLTRYLQTRRAIENLRRAGDLVISVALGDDRNEVIAIRDGRLVSADVNATGADPLPLFIACEGPSGDPAHHDAETLLIHRYLLKVGSQGARVEHCTGVWAESIERPPTLALQPVGKVDKHVERFARSA
ncbi:MAG: DEDD exonuclease domain-containing protein [Actinomycetota bacterium]